MGIGLASGEKRAEEAAQKAINSPLLEVSISGARGVLFAIAGGEDLSMLEVQDAARVITDSIDANARVIFGAIRDEKLKKDEIKVTVIATGFPDELMRVTSEPLFSIGNRASREREEELTPGQIHNAISDVRAGAAPRNIPDRQERPGLDVRPVSKQPERTNIKANETDTDQNTPTDDDGEWAVPAFLRRSKIK
jgi:cell division protein FtsZ